MAFLAGEPNYTTLANHQQLPILTPSLAKQETFKMRLENGMEVYIIEDPEATEAGAVLTVQAGNWDDPEKYPGLAHFVEHMLFLGTEKYPNESEYDHFIRSNNGQTNAYTTTDHTLYLFSVSPPAFEEALDRFSFFFKKPLFNPSGIDRELHAVDEEFAKNLDQDGFRENQVRKELANPQHPFHRFSSGNLQSLATVKQEDLKQWYQDHYSAHLMRLIVYGPYSIKTLKNWVVQDFQEIPSIDRLPFHSSAPILREDLQGQMVSIQTLKNMQTLHFSWELPASVAYSHSFKPSDVISSLLGNEGAGSLLDILKSEGLAYSLGSADQRLSKDNLLFSLHIDLTQKGMEQMPRVIEYTFQAIQNLQKEPLPSYIFDQIKQMHKLRYQYQSRENVFDYLMTLGGLFVYEDDISAFPENLLVPQSFDQQKIDQFLNHLTPQKTYFTLLTQHPSVQFNQIEQWMKVPYHVNPIPAKQLDAWSHLPFNSRIQLPTPNPFIPKDLTLINETASQENSQDTILPQPVLLVDDSQAKIYFAQDHRFRTPQIQWFFEIKTPSIDINQPQKGLLADIYLRYLEESLLPYRQKAEEADFSYQISRTSNGILLSLTGYSDHAEALFDLILERLKNSRPPESFFQQLKGSFLRKSRHVVADNPLQQGFNTYQTILYDSPSPNESTHNLENVSYRTFLDYIDHLYDNTFIEGLVYGNINEAQALNIWKKLQTTLNSQPFPRSQWVIEKNLVALPQGPYAIELQSPSPANAVVLGIEENASSSQTRAAQQILSQAMSSAFYSTLRTKQQTGYLVSSRFEEVNKHPFTFFAVQSSTHDPHDLLARFELFIESYAEELGKTELTEDQFDHLRQSLLMTLEHSPQNLTDTGLLLKKLAFEYEGDFNLMNKRIEGFKELTYPELIEFAKNFLGKQNKHRLAVLIQGKADPNFHYQSLSNPNEIRQLAQYHPTTARS